MHSPASACTMLCSECSRVISGGIFKPWVYLRAWRAFRLCRQFVLFRLPLRATFGRGEGISLQTGLLWPVVQCRGAEAEMCCAEVGLLVQRRSAQACGRAWGRQMPSPPCKPARAGGTMLLPCDPPRKPAATGRSGACATRWTSQFPPPCLHYQ